MYDILIKAMHFASEKHRFQHRKGGNIPYINHPIKVAHILIEKGGVNDISILVAAILHDTIEDTATSQQEIEEIFGVEVLSIVMEVTDDKLLSKEERKRMQIVKAASKSDKAKMLKIADKICNISDMVLSPPNWPIERKQEYVAWAKAVVEPMRGVNPALEAHFDECVVFCEKHFVE